MSTVKIVLRQKPNKDGTLPLCLRITKDRKSSFIHLGYSLKEADWEPRSQRVKRSHPHYVRLNNFLIKKLSEANDGALELETNKREVSTKAVKQRIKPSAGANFNAQTEVYLNKLQSAGKYNQYTADKPRVKHFKEFIGEGIAFQNITPGILERFKGYVRHSLQLSERSAINHLVMVCSVFSNAIKESVVDPRYYPFGKGKVKIKFPKSVKVGLTAEDIKNVGNVALENEYEDHCRKLFLFSFYFAGMRVSDVLRLQFSDFKNMRLHYTMGKNNKNGTLKIPEKAEEIVRHYEQFRTNNDDLIFRELKRLDNLDDSFKTQRSISFATSRIDKCLRKEVSPKAGVDKKLTMHIARHSFGNISGDKIPVQMLQKLYRHTKLETIIGYQSNFIHKDADDALDAVLKF